MFAAACTQTEGISTSAIVTRDSEDVGSELGGSAGEDAQEMGGVAQQICVAAAASINTREAFCRSVLVPPYLKQPCWSKVPESAAQWIGWCAWVF